MHGRYFWLKPKRLQIPHALHSLLGGAPVSICHAVAHVLVCTLFTSTFRGIRVHTTCGDVASPQLCSNYQIIVLLGCPVCCDAHSFGWHAPVLVAFELWPTAIERQNANNERSDGPKTSMRSCSNSHSRLWKIGVPQFAQQPRRASAAQVEISDCCISRLRRKALKDLVTSVGTMCESL